MLGERHIYPDAERGLRVDELFRLVIEGENARRPQRADGRLDSVVAGEGYATVDSWRGDEIDLPFPVAA